MSIAMELLRLRLHFCVLLEFPFVKKLNCFKETVESCELRDNVFETQRERFELRGPCFPPDQLASSPQR
jgi:hypothetical protein